MSLEDSISLDIIRGDGVSVGLTSSCFAGCNSLGCEVGSRFIETSGHIIGRIAIFRVLIIGSDVGRNQQIIKDTINIGVGLLLVGNGGGVGSLSDFILFFENNNN